MNEVWLAYLAEACEFPERTYVPCHPQSRGHALWSQMIKSASHTMRLRSEALMDFHVLRTALAIVL